MSDVKKNARAMSRQTNDLDNALACLSLAAPPSSSSIPTPTSRPLLKEYSETSKTLFSESDDDDDDVAEDWDAAADFSSDNEAASPKNNSGAALPKNSHFRIDSTNGPNVPPPTPISPANSYGGGSPFPFGSPNTASSSIADRFAQSPSGHAPSSPRRSSSRTTQSSSSRTPTLRDPGVRQEKTDAVAKRLIAGALGIKAPKKTEEQRQYDRAVREKEMRRRNEEKERVNKGEEEKERAKAAVWED